jgi:hypothetical protein
MKVAIEQGVRPARGDGESEWTMRKANFTKMGPGGISPPVGLHKVWPLVIFIQFHDFIPPAAHVSETPLPRHLLRHVLE